MRIAALATVLVYLVLLLVPCPALRRRLPLPEGSATITMHLTANQITARAGPKRAVFRPVAPNLEP